MLLYKYQTGGAVTKPKNNSSSLYTTVINPIIPYDLFSELRNLFAIKKAGKATAAASTAAAGVGAASAGVGAGIGKGVKAPTNYLYE